MIGSVDCINSGRITKYVTHLFELKYFEISHVHSLMGKERYVVKDENKINGTVNNLYWNYNFVN